MKLAKEFFETAEERHRIYLRKEIKRQAFPWTEDPILRDGRFCNVFRELDKTTQWFKHNVRDVAPPDKVLQATIAFRWFNRIEVGERIKHLLINGWDGEAAYELLRDVKPVVTGAYMIRTPEGLPKLEGVLHNIKANLNEEVADLAAQMLDGPMHLEEAWQELRKRAPLGPFMAYEVISDMRWRLMVDAPDINSWANAGPGCARGLGRVVHGNCDVFDKNSREDQETMLGHMRELLAMSRNFHFWPEGFPRWEMREVEHWLCEFDKYRRVLGGASLKRKYVRTT